MELMLVSGNGCASCVSMLDIASNLAKKHNLDFIHHELEDDDKIVEKYGINKVPSVLLTDGDKLIAMVGGFQPYEILDMWIDYKINE